MKDDAVKLVGSIELPLKVGTVGGQVQSTAAVQIVHRLMMKMMR
jgi:hydroxymethylglutaryl-CoA reductase